MTLSEFKAWFEGFTEDMGERPTAEQWERIQARVAEITGQTVTYPVYVDRYVPQMIPYWQRYGYGSALQGQFFNGNLNAMSNASLQGMATQSQAYDSHAAMNALGRAEAKGEA